jgi:hypothetical protein
MTYGETRQNLALALTSFLVLATFALPSKAADTAKAEEHAATVRSTLTSSTEFVRGLTMALQKETRDDVWASGQEADLRATYNNAGTALPRSGLKFIDCRYSRCAIQLQIDVGSTLNEAIAQQAAINRWISTSQPCSFTLMPIGHTGALQGEVQIFLNCPR